MSETQDQFSDVGTAFEFSGPVPAARPLSDFCLERIGEEVVLYDPEHIQYHTLNAIAYSIWTLCDGQLTVQGISETLSKDHSNVHVQSGCTRDRRAW